jgi:DNA-binding NarL/FixJ family response regulator
MMSVNSILLIDHDDMVLGLLRGSILGKTPSITVEIARNIAEAAMRLQSRKHTCVICDYDLLSENDFELYGMILANQESSSKLVATCYGNPGELKYGVHATPALAVSKPIDQKNLEILLSQILGAEVGKTSEEISITEATSKDIENELKELRRNTNARCIVVSNQDGRVLVQEGDTENLSVDGLATLVSGSIITLEEVGHMFHDPTVINLAFREGAKSDLYVMNIGERLMLILIQDKGMITPKLGTVWFYARQSAIAIDQFINNPSTAKKDGKTIDKSDTTVVAELDKMFKND